MIQALMIQIILDIRRDIMLSKYAFDSVCEMVSNNYITQLSQDKSDSFSLI